MVADPLLHLLEPLAVMIMTGPRFGKALSAAVALATTVAATQSTRASTQGRRGGLPDVWARWVRPDGCRPARPGSSRRDGVDCCRGSAGLAGSAGREAQVQLMVSRIGHSFAEKRQPSRLDRTVSACSEPGNYRHASESASTAPGSLLDADNWRGGGDAVDGRRGLLALLGRSVSLLSPLARGPRSRVPVGPCDEPPDVQVASWACRDIAHAMRRQMLEVHLGRAGISPMRCAASC